MNYKVTIKTPNKIFIVKNRAIRSPFESVMGEDNLKLIKSRIKFYGLTNQEFIIQPLNVEEDKKKDYSYIPSQRQPDKKIRNQEENSNEVPNPPPIESLPKKKVVTKPKRTSYKVQETILNPEQLFSNPTSNQEQIIKDNVSDVEVKIEELSVKATSILDKFLHSE